MTSLLINKGQFKSSIVLPRSKSFANRALILAALSHRRKTILEVPLSTDVTHLLDAFKQIGLKITTEGSSVSITNSFPQCETTQIKPILIGEGGTTARFLACLLMKGSLKYELILGDRLKDRPWTSFIQLMNDLGGKVSLEGNKLTLQGPVSLPPHLEVDCSQTTQIASGLQLAHSETQILPYLMKTSKSYWDLTLELIKEVNQLDIVTVPMDWSSASYPLAFGALIQTIQFPGLAYDKFQADAKFLGILHQFGAIKEEALSGVTVHKFTKAQQVTIDVRDCLDLVPALSFFLAHIPGEHKLSGVENLIHKESDRLSEVMKLLSQFNRQTNLENNVLKITGSDQMINSKVTLQLPDDHRMVMAGTLFLLLHGGGDIAPKEAVSKSFPHYFSLLA